MKFRPLNKLYYQSRDEYEAEYTARFQSPYAVHLDFQVAEHQAFFVVTPEIQRMLSNILRMDKAVANLRSLLPGIAINQFSQRCLVDEIVLTNNIEGVHSTRREISALLDDLNERSRGKRFYGLVQKYIMLRTSDDIPLDSSQDIRAIYDDLVLAEVGSDDAANLPDGQLFRKGPVSLYSATQKEIHRGVYPEEKIISSMEQALTFLGDESCEILYRIAIFHYLIEYIHPFYDGNGRLGRFIASYLLSHTLDAVTGYRLSYTIKEHISAYYEAFSVCNQDINRGDLTPFLLMFMTLVEESMEKLKRSLEQGAVLLSHYRNRLTEQKFDQKQLWLYDLLIQAALFSEHGIKTKELVEVGGVSRSTVDALLKRIPPQLLVRKKQGTAYCFSIDLKEFDKL